MHVLLLIGAAAHGRAVHLDDPVLLQTAGRDLHPAAQVCLPQDWAPENYTNALAQADFVRGFFNSIYIALTVTIVS